VDLDQEIDQERDPTDLDLDLTDPTDPTIRDPTLRDPDTDIPDWPEPEPSNGDNRPAWLFDDRTFDTGVVQSLEELDEDSVEDPFSNDNGLM
jgi:hypothetical protein